MTTHLLSRNHLDEGLAKAELVEIESCRRPRVVLTQGYNWQIRRMFYKLNYKVRKLERIRVGNLMANDLYTISSVPEKSVWPRPPRNFSNQAHCV